MGPGDGEALWFNGALGLVKATGVQTDGRFAAVEFLAPKGFAALLHVHRAEDEFFLVLSGEVRVKHGDSVIEAVPGSRGREAGRVRGTASRRRVVHRSRSAHANREPLRPGVCRSTAFGSGLTSSGYGDPLTQAIRIRAKATTSA